MSDRYLDDILWYRIAIWVVLNYQNCIKRYLWNIDFEAIKYNLQYLFPGLKKIISVATTFSFRFVENPATVSLFRMSGQEGREKLDPWWFITHFIANTHFIIHWKKSPTVMIINCECKLKKYGSFVNKKENGNYLPGINLVVDTRNIALWKS